MILNSFQAEHNAVFIVAEKLKRGELEPKDADELIRETIKVHYRDEEEIFFPSLVEFLPHEIEKMRRDHQRIREAYASLAGSLDPTGLQSVLEQMMKHCEEEEVQIYDQAEDLLGTDALRQLQSKRKECSCCGHYQ